MRERDRLGNPGIDGRVIIRWTFRKRDRGYGLALVGSGRDRWQALVNAIMNLWVP
jgi:hypothetical protein